MESNLKTLRKKKGLTQEKLARECGINRVTIARYETGKSGMTAKSILRLCKVLGVSSDMLLKGGATDGKAS